jgi:ankyrin repeat protein
VWFALAKRVTEEIRREQTVYCKESNMARKKSQKKQQETTLVPHRTPEPNLSTLLRAAKDGASAQAVKAFLDAGGSVEVFLESCTLLHFMALHNPHPHTELAESVRLLVAAGADIDVMAGPAGDEGTALMCASERSCCSNAMEAFLQNGADVWVAKADGMTALHHAAAAGCIDSCAALLATDSVLVHADDVNGCTALMHAVAHGSIDTAQLLCQHGAVMYTVDFSGKTAVMVVKMSASTWLLSYSTLARM